MDELLYYINKVYFASLQEVRGIWDKGGSENSYSHVIVQTL